MDRRKVLFGGMTTICMPSVTMANPCEKGAKAKFLGKPQLQPEYPDLFRLTMPFTFVDGCGKNWTAPAGTVTDGASIPWIVQPFTGDAFKGPYFSAAVIHDWYCSCRTELHDDVHRMFYNAMITSHVGDTLARIMYTAVCWRGPKWTNMDVMNNRLKLAVDPNAFYRPPAPPPVLAMEIPPAPPPPKPDHGLIEAARGAMKSQDHATSEALLAEFDEQVSAYEAWEIREAAVQKKARDLESARILQRAASNAKLEKDREQFRDLIRATDGKSLDQIRSIASSFPV